MILLWFYQGRFPVVFQVFIIYVETVQYIQLLCYVNWNFYDSLTLYKKGSLEEAYSIKHKCFLTCSEYPCGSYRWPSFQSARFATGTRDQWHPLWSVVMLRQKVIQLQLLAFSNLLAEVDNSPIRRGMTEDIWGQSRQQTWNAGCCLQWDVRTCTSFLFWAYYCVLYQLLPEEQWKKKYWK